MASNNPNSNKPGSPKKPKFAFNLYWIYAIIAIVLIGIQLFSTFGSSLKKINDDQELKNLIVNNDVEKIIVVNDKAAEIYIKESLLDQDRFKDVSKGSFGNSNKGPHYIIENTGGNMLFKDKLKEIQTSGSDSTKTVVLPEVKYETRKNILGEILMWIVPIGLMILVWVFIMRRMGGGGGGGQIFNIGKAKAKMFDGENVTITFDSVAGLDEAKQELKEIVDFLKSPKKYTDLGAKIPKGALLVGPPGTGKTLLAKAIAGEAKVPFFSMSGSDFVEMFVGVGASRVRDLFKQAKEKAPAIIFIDEVDAIGRARGRSVAQGANDERESTLNQMLTEMDGFESNTGVIVIAATNRADILDKALLRPGRFDRQIFVDLPDLVGRKEIFKVHMRPLKKLATDVDVEQLARQTPGFSGADIANVCNESALIAARKNKHIIDRQDFNDAIDRVIGGLEKRNKVIAPKEKKTIAFHEAGHATVSWLLEHASPLVKVTIIPRGQSLGAAWYMPEERQITTKEQMIDELCAALGGRAAEDIMFGKVSTGALSDLEKVTKQSYAMVSIYGLNDKIGNISFYDSTGQSDYTFSKPYSEKTAEIIDEEVKKMVDECYQRTKKVLIDNKANLEILASRLLEKEILYREDLEEIFGLRTWDEGKDVVRVKESETYTEKPVQAEEESEKKDTDTPPPAN
jgi:ATP-dependent metalloprotease FtsH